MGRARLAALAAVLAVVASACLAPRAEASAPAKAQPSIIGGSDADIADWPWQAALLKREGNKGFQQICGGSLIAPTVVLTAAHCVFDPNFFEFEKARRFRVVTGRTKLSSGEGQELVVKKIHFFKRPNGLPRYDAQTSEWDVVLLELKDPSTSPTIKIAGPDESGLWAGLQDGWVTGWGATDKRGFDPSNKLQAAKVQINPTPHCRSVYATFSKRVMMCAGGGRPQRDTCFGDSGGPLVVPMAGGGFRLVGDTSFGGRRCGAGAAYGRLAADPIRSKVRDKVLSLTGVDVIGSGAAPVPPTLPRNPLTGSLANLRAVAYLFSRCGRNCVDFRVATCKSRGAGFRCKVKKFVFQGRKRKTLSRDLKITQKRNGAIKAKPKGKWKKRRGWLKSLGG